MNSFERWSLRLGAGLATLTGLVYGALRYFGSVEGEFGPEPSPWLGVWQHAHVLAAPVLVFAFGVVMAGHAHALLEGRIAPGRRTGMSLALVGVPLVMGGYLIQVVTTSGTRAALGWLHAGLGVLFALAYLAHWGKRLPAALAARAERSSSQRQG